MAPGFNGPCRLDQVLTGAIAEYRAQVATIGTQLAASSGYRARLAAKERPLAETEKRRPLVDYRSAELAVMTRIAWRRTRQIESRAGTFAPGGCGLGIPNR